MSLTWSKLELKKASTVRKEIDNAIKKFEAAVEQKDHELLSSLRDAFEARIDQLEEFFGENDDDDRAVLFEKQRARLRHTLQSAPLQSPTHKPTPTKSSTALANAPGTFAPGGGRFGTFAPDPVRTSPTIKTPATGMAATTSPKKKSMGRSPMSPMSSTTKSPTSSAKKKSTKPLYSWEKTASSKKSKPKDRTIITNDHGEFIPSLEEGFYEKRNAVPSSTKFIDFQVVMTQENYEELMKRRRRQKADARHTARFTSKKVAETEYLNVGTPYVDKGSIVSGLYRS